MSKQERHDSISLHKKQKNITIKANRKRQSYWRNESVIN
nr:MAG TPA: hypothetical protein [Caudoviricetes sp.]